MRYVIHAYNQLLLLISHQECELCFDVRNYLQQVASKLCFTSYKYLMFAMSRGHCITTGTTSYTQLFDTKTAAVRVCWHAVLSATASAMYAYYSCTIPIDCHWVFYTCMQMDIRGHRALCSGHSALVVGCKRCRRS
jgi:hypothetical protein